MAKRLEGLLGLLKEVRDPIAEQTTFALELSRLVALTEEASVKNFAFSPLSIYTILAFMAAGSKDSVLDQTLSTVRSPSIGDLSRLSSRINDLVLADGSPWSGPLISSVNGAWIDSSLSLKPSFVDIATSVYKAQAKTVNFITKPEEARYEINSWVENATAGLINNLLPKGSINDETALVLANALYFKGTWVEEFDKSQTKKSEFHLLDGRSSTRVPFMTTQDDQLISAYNGFKVLCLPYKQGNEDTMKTFGFEYNVGRRFSMFVLLPDKRDGLWDLWERLSSEPKFLDRYNPSLARVRRFKLPKFKVEFGLEASQVLKGMGLVLPFEEGSLTEMAGSRIGVSAIFHKSAVEVTEEGTEAAAATAMVGMMMACSSPEPLPPIVDFEADHPFIYLIRENISGAVMFVGHVLDPSMVE